MNGLPLPVIPAKPEERKERQEGEEVDPGGSSAQPGEPAVGVLPVGEDAEGGFDLSRLEIGDEEEGVAPHFLGDRLLTEQQRGP